MRGENGVSVTRIYLPAELTTAGTSESPDARSAAPSTGSKARKRLTWDRAAEGKKMDRPPHFGDSDVESERNLAARANPAPLAGSAFGSLAYGNTSGQEVRPAIRVAGSEPVLSGLPDVHEGNEIVELTIDEQGNIVQKVVMQSLGPAVDNAILAALQDWRFRPATRDGVVIPSKQDVYYHFPLRR
jgi:TonB family protein